MQNMGWLLIALGVAGCDGGGGGSPDAPADPCELVSTYTCTSPDYCDEVYSASSAADLAELCDGDDDTRLPGRCDHTACCYGPVGLFGDGSMHCVGPELAVGYRGVCADRGGTYCER